MHTTDLARGRRASFQNSTPSTRPTRTVVNADGEQNADVYIRGGKVEKVVDRTDSAAAAAAIHEAEADVAEWRVIDAKEKYVMPGGIDPHTHFEMPFMGQVRCCVAINKSPMFDPHTMQCFPSHASESFETTH